MDEEGSLRSFMLWAPWQSMQEADLFSPMSTMARLWMLCWYCFAAPGMAMFRLSVIVLSPWHRVHVAAMFRK